MAAARAAPDLRRAVECVEAALDTIPQSIGDAIDEDGLFSVDLAATNGRSAYFSRGGKLYPGSAFMDKTQIRIAVRNPKAIKGILRVSEEDFRPSSDLLR
jgi:hypothetical protein